MATICTIGHSTRTLDELVAALKAHRVGTLVDIRAFPKSRRLPHFNRESLEVELPKHGIRYVWMSELGGYRRKVRDDSPNTGLRNDSFRNYADYMLTDEFARAVTRLLHIAQETAGPLRQAHGRLSACARPARSGPGKEDALSLGRTQMGSEGKTAIMCAERVYFQCHRMLVSDYLVAHGHAALHIDDEKRPPREHKLTAEARLVDGKLVYDAQQRF